MSSLRSGDCVIFLVLCQAVQVFMSYDGGATPASLDSIANATSTLHWTQADLALLCSLDKFAMTFSSVIWGIALKCLPVKMCLVVGLGVNAVSTYCFGHVAIKWVMYTSKFCMGLTQSLQVVWSTCWVLMWSPEDRRTIWLALGGVSSGLGNLIGTAVAGFGTSSGLSYSVAWAVQSGVLSILWFVLTFLISGPSLDIAPNVDVAQGSQRISGNEHARRRVFKSLLCNPLYVRTAFALASIMYVQSGVQSLWVRLYVNAWHLAKSIVVLGFISMCTLAAAVGLSFGPSALDKCGGVDNPMGRSKSMKLLTFMMLGAVSGASIALLGVLIRSRFLLGQNLYLIAAGESDVDLYLSYFGTLISFIFFQGSVAGLTSVNIGALQSDLWSLGSGMAFSLQNLVGYSLGPLFPGLVMDHLSLNLKNPLEKAEAFCCGSAVAIGGTFMVFFFTWAAMLTARAELDGYRKDYLLLEQDERH